MENRYIERPSMQNRLKIFFRIYWKSIFVLVIPILLLPVACIKNSNAYKSFYVFLIFATYSITNVLPQCISTIIVVAFLAMFGLFDPSFVSIMHVSGTILDTFSVMLIVIAVEASEVHRRLAIKLILFTGCSHFRISFLLFFTAMLLSIWISSTMACGLMLPLVKAVLAELEKLGLIEIHQAPQKRYQNMDENEPSTPLPSDVTTFYFLGIAYSSSVGSMASIAGSKANQVFKLFCEMLFPRGAKLQFPYFTLLSLPGMLLIQALLFFWMNSYFLGMFRVQSEVALQITMTEEEAQYVKTLLTTTYIQMGKISFHDIAIFVVVILAFVLEVAKSSVYLLEPSYFQLNGYVKMCGPGIISLALLFLIPIDLDFVKFFRKNFDGPLPKHSSKACLNWKMVREKMQWSVLIILGGSTCIFDQLRDSHMTDELEKLLLLTAPWATPGIALVVIVFCKVLSEFAPNSTVVYCLLPLVARLSTQIKLHPHYLMLAATLASSLPFHLVAGCPANALVSAYVRIPGYKMLQAGVVPSLIAILITWFTVVVWSKAVWPEINVYPEWANHYVSV